MFLCSSWFLGSGETGNRTPPGLWGCEPCILPTTVRENHLNESSLPPFPKACKQLLLVQLNKHELIFTFELPLWRSEGKKRYGRWLFMRRGDVSS